MPYCHCLQHSKPGTRSSGARHPNQGPESHALLPLFAAFQTWNPIIRSPSSQSGLRVSCPTAIVCSIPNLEPDHQEPVIPIRAQSLMPYCHFDLEDSDYIRSARRNPELPGPKGAPAGTTLDPNTKVIEFHSVGVGLQIRQTFHIINPTSHDYVFHWLNEDHLQPKHILAFRCLTPDGVVKSGKRAEVGGRRASFTLFCIVTLIDSLIRLVG